MRIITLSFLLLISSLCYSQKEITVSNTDELLMALFDDDVIIKVNEGEYRLWESELFPGGELTLDGKTSMSIEGVGDNPAKILINEAYYNVIHFRNSKNIKLENLELGHDVEKGYCTGGVVYLDNCNNVEINDCILFGSGTYGIEGESIMGLYCDNTVIKECTYGIISVKSLDAAEFTKCKFYDNQEFDLISIHNGNSVTFSKCEFFNNKTGISYPSVANESLFNITNGIDIVVKNSKIKNNSVQYLCNQNGAVLFKDVEYEDNNWNSEYKNK